MIIKRIEVGSEVMVPRAGGNSSYGVVKQIHHQDAWVEFPIGDTKGVTPPHLAGKMAHKYVPINRLELVH